MSGQFVCQLLGNHDRASFACGEPSLDDFLKTKARRQQRSFGTTFIGSPAAAPLQIASFYTLANHSLDVTALPEALKRKSPYPKAPATLLGRLAVATDFQGQGLGEWTLMEALRRAYEATAGVASFAVVTDPLHEKARDFYLKYGFAPLPGGPRLFLTMATIGELKLSS